MTSFESTNSVSNITDENNSFSITRPGHWNSKSTEKTIDELNMLYELRSENDIELHTEQLGKEELILIKDYSLSSLGTLKKKYLKN